MQQNMPGVLFGGADSRDYTESAEAMMRLQDIGAILREAEHDTSATTDDKLRFRLAVLRFVDEDIDAVWAHDYVRRHPELSNLHSQVSREIRLNRFVRTH